MFASEGASSTPKADKLKSAVDEQARRRAEFERLKAERGVTSTRATF